MSTRSVVIYTTGSAGSGKTYRRCASYLVEWLTGRADGPRKHLSNFPIRFARLASAVGQTEEWVRERVEVLSEEELRGWEAGTSGPWHTFRDVDLTGCHLALDEVHRFVPRGAKSDVRRKWQAWLGEIRHRGATVEFLSQHPAKVAKEIEYECGVRLSLLNSETRRDPICGIELGDWYELRAGLMTGDYTAGVWELERRHEEGKWKLQDQRFFRFEPELFEVYDSYSPGAAGEGATAPPLRVWQRKSKLGLIWWFIWRNVGRLGWRVGAACLIVLLMTGGGSWMFPALAKLLTPGGWGSRAKPQSVSVATVGVGRQPAVGEVAVIPPSPVASTQPAASGTRGSADAALTRRLDAAEARVRELEAERERQGTIVGGDGVRVVQRGGWWLGVGELVQVGPYRGQRVVRISWDVREVEFDSGEIVRW